MIRLALLFSAATAVAIGGGCADCRSRGETGSAPAASASTPPAIELGPERRPQALTWRLQNDARGFGLPAGCRLELPIRHAKLPAQAVRFTAPRSELHELALAFATPGNPTTSHSGVLDLRDGKVRDLPWFELDRPPAFDRTSAGWVAAFTKPGEDGKSTAVFWSQQDPVQVLASGDQLAVTDVACRGTICAVLTTLARAAAAPGASLHVVVPGSKATSVDLEGDPGVPWQPLAIAFFDGTAATVALRSPTATALWNVAGGRPTKLYEVETQFGVYDTLATKNMLIIAPGAATSEPCKLDHFPIRILGRDGKAHVLRSQAAPESLMIRPLDSGALILWVAPISCTKTQRTVVYAALVDSDGAPMGSAMSVADAVGFAAATRGAELALWLRTAEGLTSIRAECKGVSPP